MLHLGVQGALASMVGRWLERPAMALTPAAHARACVVLWLNGGPSHLDTWDPKPGTATGGPFKAIPTRIPGALISEHLPLMAELADRLAIVRGMTSKEGSHERAQHLMHTGYVPNPTVAHPSLGAWVSEELGDPAFDLPSFVSIGGPSLGAGILGVQHGPFIVQSAKQMPQNVTYAKGVDGQRFDVRQGALEDLEEQFAAATQDPIVAGRREVYGKAMRLMRSPRLKAFDITQEPAATLARYGDTDFGRGCLMARRLIEAGVRYVEVVLDGWDTHVDNFGRTTRLMQAFDPAMSALMGDLEERKLLEHTLLVSMGEFGRTPVINLDQGRDHHPNAWSAVLAGGGIRGGLVHGATDPSGARVVEQAVQVPDLFATLAVLLGLNPDHTVVSPLGRPISLTDSGKPIASLIAS